MVKKMAQQRQQAGGGDNNAAHWRSYGLKDEHPEEPEQNVNEGEDDQGEDTEEETEESEGGDADAPKDKVAASDAAHDQKADKGDDGESEPSGEKRAKTEQSKKKTATATAADKAREDAVKAKDAAEERMRTLQSRADRAEAALANQMRSFQAELNAMKRGSPNSATEGDLPELDDDAVIDGKTLKGLLKGQAAKRQQEDAQLSTQTQKMEWVKAQPEIADVRKLLQEEKWNSDPDILNIPTDSIGIFFKARVRILEKQMEAMKKTHQQEIEKTKAEERKKFGTRKPIPPTGGHGGDDISKSAGSAPLNDMERRFLKFAGKNAKIVPYGR